MVAELTAAQIEDIRGNAGDDCTPYNVSDETLERWWQASDGVECEVVVKVLRRLVGKSQTLVNESNNQEGSRSQAAIFEHRMNNLRLWEQRCGMAGGSLTTGVLDLGIDQEEDS